MSDSQTLGPGSERTLRSSARNPRRRQRQSDGDSLKTAPRRKRSKLSEDTFAPSRDSVETEDTASTAVMNGHPRGSVGRTKESTPAMSVDMELPMRGNKKAGTVKRAMKGDGATVLAANMVYSVKLLPSTPKELRKEGVEFRGSLLRDQHLALAVTKQKAYVWDYTAHAPSTNARVFDVPFPTHEGETLPFGALVHSGASATDVGLVLVAAHGGKVVFHESIERAASLGLFQERRIGVEGMLAGLYSGETVTHITPAEHAGFVLTLSSGRILQMTLRDAQGKARISTHFLQSIDPASRGLFGTIKRFAGLVSKNVTAVRTRPLGTRGQMQVLALTDTGIIETWDLDWSGRSEARGTVDFRELLINGVKSVMPPEMQGRADSIQCLDLAPGAKPATAKGNEVATLGTEQPIDVWLLLSIGGAETKEYFVAEISLAGAGADITRFLRLESYHGSGRKGGLVTKPRLLVPEPGHTVFIAFADAVVLAETADQGYSEPDPNAQLHEASYVAPQAFEDAVFLRADANAAIMDASGEVSKAGHASCVAFVKGAGLVRFSATDPAGDVQRSRIPAKSKLEEGVFHGLALQPENILDFTREGEGIYSVEEIEAATIAISGEVLRSETSSLSKSPPSIEVHLDYKARALKALVAHVRQSHPTLSRSTMWHLLWDAEKVAAAQQLWKAFEEDRAASPKGKKTATVLDELCRQAAQLFGWQVADGDAVQAFFVQHLDSISWVLPQTRHLIETMRGTPPDTDRTLRAVEGADDIWLRTIETVFAFRAENAGAYGIAPEFIEEGILTDPSEYIDLPSFWTSSEAMLKAIVHICTSSRELAKRYFEHSDTMPEVEDHCRIIVTNNPRLVQLCCLIYQERIHWLAARSSEKDVELANKLQENYDDQRHEQFRALADVAQAEAGMKLAEKYRDMRTLTEMVVAESQYALETRSTTQDEREKAACEAVIADSIQRIGKYFDKFGDDWANAFFDEAFSSSRAGHMLNESQRYWGDALTRYLRSDPSRARLCWINDVTAKNDYRHAGTVLMEAAVEQETQLWAKKVELSISKLALLAAAESHSQDSQAPQELLVNDEQQLNIVETQEKLYRHFFPELLLALDHEAEVEVVMQKFGSHLHDYSSLRQLLETGVDRVLQHKALSVEELIDVLTLINTVTYEKGQEPAEGNLQGSEFYHALTVLEAAAAMGTIPSARFEVLLQLIWKRCYVADDWVRINSMQSGSKGATQEQLWEQIRQGAAWHTFYHLHDQQRLPLSSSAIRVLTPSECLGAGCVPEDLAWRFPDRDLLDPILHDNQIQDELLQAYVADRRLESWVEMVEKDAKTVVEEGAEGEAMAREREREMVEVIRRKDEAVRGRKEEMANGHVNGVKGEDLVDGDGDVDME